MKSFKEQLIENNYLVIDNFVDENYAKTLYKLFKKDSEQNPEVFINDKQCPNSLAFYDWRWFLELLVERTSILNQILEEPLLPTYSYARIYKKGEILEKHTDRESCEISVSVHLDGDGTPWDIFFTKPNGESVALSLKSGQAVVYLGCISEHWREAFNGEHYGQVFLHYVKSRGSNWIYYFDKYKDFK